MKIIGKYKECLKILMLFPHGVHSSNICSKTSTFIQNELIAEFLTTFRH